MLLKLGRQTLPDISHISNSLLSLYDAAYLDQDWVRALDAVGAVSQAKGVMVFATDQTNQLSFDVGFSNSLYADKGDVLAEYNRLFVRNRDKSWDAEGVEILLNKPLFRAVLDTDLWPLDYLRSVPEVQYIQEHVGVFRRVAFNLSGTPELQAGLILQYGKEITTPPQSDLQFMPRLMPHVGKALRTSRFFSPLRQRYNAVLSVLDRLNLAVSVLDQEGRVVVANRAAKDLLHRKDGVHLSSDGRVRCRSETENGAFTTAWKKIAQTARGKSQATDASVLVSRRDHPDPLLAILSPLRDARGEVDRSLSGCMVAFVDTARSAEIDIDTFGLAYGLTPAECAVAVFLCDGGSTSEIAERRSVSRETIATQIKSILAKTNTRNRVQFVWKLIQFAPPIM